MKIFFDISYTGDSDKSNTFFSLFLFYDIEWIGGLFPITNAIYSVSIRDCGKLIAKLPTIIYPCISILFNVYLQLPLLKRKV